MQIVTIDGTKVIEINHIDANLKMACVAENNGDTTVAAQHLAAALKAEADERIGDKARRKMEEVHADDWEGACLRWHGRKLTHKWKHYCPDWDYLPIDSTCVEIETCTCTK